MKIGVIHSCFKTNVKDALRIANELGLSGVQIYATRGEFSPWTLTEEDIAEYKALLEKYDLEVSALCGDMGGFGFEIEEDNPERVEKTCRIVDLAVKLGIEFLGVFLCIEEALRKTHRATEICLVMLGYRESIVVLLEHEPVGSSTAV